MFDCQMILLITYHNFTFVEERFLTRLHLMYTDQQT